MFEVRVVVNNTTYTWKEVEIAKKEVNGCYQLLVEGNPKVVNRRKHPRWTMSNACEIKLHSNQHTYSGRIANISAGGYAFACKDAAFAEAVGERVDVMIRDFEPLNGGSLPGIIIRSTDDRGTYIVGCRMLEDNKTIGSYIEEKMKK